MGGHGDLAQVLRLAEEGFQGRQVVQQIHVIVPQQLVGVEVGVAVLGRVDTVCKYPGVLCGLFGALTVVRGEHTGVVGGAEAEVVEHGVGHLLERILLVVVHVLFEGSQGVDEGDCAAGLEVYAGVVARTAVAYVLSLLETVGLEQGVHHWHVVFAPHVHLYVVDLVDDSVADVQVLLPLVDELVKGLQPAVVGREHHLAGALVNAVGEHQLKHLGQAGEVYAGAAGGRGAAGDHSDLAVVLQGQEAAGCGLQAAAQAPGPGVVEVHALGTVLAEHEVHAHLIIHPGGIAHAQLGACRGLHQEVLRQLFVIENGQRGLRRLRPHTGLDDEIFQGRDGGEPVVVLAAQGEVVEGVAREHAA